MGKTIKSCVWQMVFTMTSKWKQKQKEKEAVFKQKMECLDAVTEFDKLHVFVQKLTVSEKLQKLKELELNDLLSQTKYLEEIYSMTNLSFSTLKRLNNEGKVNYGCYSTPGKKKYPI